jgi:type I restriction enzyme S subunit
MSEEIKIPKGWKIVNLKSITDSIQYGYTKSSSKVKIGPKFLRITDIQDNKVQWDDVPYCKISNENRGKYLLKDGDLVFARTGATVGKSFLIKGDIPEAVFASYLIRVRVSKEINEKYLSYFFNSLNYWSQITEGQVGIGQPNVNGTKLGQLKISIAPKDEQLSIVSKIEELLSDLENGKQQLQLAQQQLKVYRQSLLKWAFEGRLTSVASTSSASESSTVVEPVETTGKYGELPEGWKWVILKDITKEISDGDHQAPPKASIGIPFITISNIIKSSNKIDFTNTFKVSQSYYQNLKINRKPFKGDVLYTVTGSFGIPVIIDFNLDFCFQRHIGLIRPLENVNQKWLYYLLQSPQIYSQAEKTATGTAQKTVALSSLRNFSIPFCTLDNQLKIVNELESKLTVCDKIEETINESLQQAETLRQSILKKAFEGKLIN